ncbi:hypothetical protein NliqN6_6637 [Naganishia liquefaciens]|uniref:Uncharacterized protein n=1 Tax=Naganishia liquefaciens TaxID=104408 RepID=A0A8H3YHP5_9TREE|nr:hypothetical protein NliqN6_6637 [Naganishia liquefaciens]
MDNPEDFERETAPSGSRRLAPMPRRRLAAARTDARESGDAGAGSTMARTVVEADELARAADELLEHFDQATVLHDGEGRHRRGNSASKAGGAKEERRIVLGSRGLHEDGSESSGGGGEIEHKMVGLMTPDDLAFKAESSASEDDWLPSTTAAAAAAAASARREHDCERDGCYGLTSRFIDDDRLSDDYAARGGGKKRKVPASAQQGPTQTGDRDETTCVHSCGHICSEATTSSIVDTMNRHASTRHDDHDNAQTDSGTCPHVRCCAHQSTIRIVPDPVIQVPKRRMTSARLANDFERRLFNARKAQVMGLHADAMTCLNQGKPKSTTTTAATAAAAAVPTREELEELVKALEYTGVAGWEGDKVGSSASGGMWDGHVLKGRVVNGTLTATSGSVESRSTGTVDAVEGKASAVDKLKWRKRGRIAERHEWQSRKPVKRGGWVPEGTFEFEIPSKVTSTIRQSTHDLNMLRAKVTQLLTLTLSSASMTSFLNGKPVPVPSPVNAVKPASSKKPTAKRPLIKEDPAQGKPRGREPLSADKVHHANGAQAEVAPSPTARLLSENGETKDSSDERTHDRIQNPPNVTVEPSADDPDYIPFSNVAGANKGKKKKKKKKSAMANAANPHHVKNYVPSRRPVNPPQADMPNLVDFLSMLFFPPPTRFLNANTGTKDTTHADGRRRETARPAAETTEEEYVCCFCEYDLFFGSEQAMFKAVRRRKKVLERRQKAQEKAKGVMAGKGLRTKSKSTGDDGGESEDDERCAGGEKCRCAEMRQQGSCEDADSRGIEDTGSDQGEDDDTGYTGSVRGHVGSEDRAEDMPRHVADPEPEFRDAGWIRADEVGQHPGYASRTACGDNSILRTGSAPLSVADTQRALPDVETFDLEEVDA